MDGLVNDVPKVRGNSRVEAVLFQWHVVRSNGIVPRDFHRCSAVTVQTDAEEPGHVDAKPDCRPRLGSLATNFTYQQIDERVVLKQQESIQ